MKGFWFAFGMVCAVVLALWFEAEDRSKKETERKPKELVEVLLPVAPSKVQRIRWRNFERGEREVQIERTPEGWRMRSPYVGPADAPRVEDLLQMVTQLRKAVKLEGVDPQKAGLEEDFVAYVELEGSFGTTRLDLGKALPHRDYGNALRVRRSGFPAASPDQATLLSFPPTIFNAINDFAEHFRDRSLAPCSVAEMITIRVLPAKEPARLELRRDPELGWIALQPYQGQLEPEIMERLVARLAGLSFLREAPEVTESTAEHGFEPPLFVIEFGDGASRVTTLELGISERDFPDMTTGAAAGRFARLPGDFRVRTVSEEALEPLLGSAQDPASGWAELRKRDLGVAGTAALTALERRGSLVRDAAGTYAFEAQQSFRLEQRGVQLVDPAGQAIEPAVASRWIDGLRALRATGFRRRDGSASGDTAMLSAAFADRASLTLLLQPPDAEGRLWVDFGDPWILAELAPEDALRLFRPLAAWR
ncbi:MAG: DUF4340 domain-containing protein [Planctomycetes bacterium]|nr:DUF4340 domain-containing protein [Planctomycetota bacterium]